MGPQITQMAQIQAREPLPDLCNLRNLWMPLYAVSARRAGRRVL